MIADVSPHRGTRLNPFAFPSDTSFRFVLLIVFVACIGISMYGSMWTTFHLTESQFAEACIIPVFRNLIHFGDIESGLEYIKKSASCIQPIRHSVPFRFAGIMLLLSVAFGIYWFFPVWKIRRDGLQALPESEMSEVMACLLDLCREAEVYPPPVFVWNPLNLNGSTLAFGRLGRYYVSLSGRLVMQFYTDRAAFQAVVRHEIAHLRNADIDLTYFTVAIWWAFVVTALIPTGLSLSWHGSDSITAYYFFVFLTISTAMVYLTRNAVLRAREFYADMRASVWDGISGSLACVIKTLSSGSTTYWRKLLRLHPDPKQRLLALADSSRLFRMSSWDAFGAGLAASLSLATGQELGIAILMSVATPDLTLYGIAGAMAIFGFPLVFLTLAVIAVGIGVAREAFSAVLQGKVLHDAGRLGVALASGMIFGLFLYHSPMTVVLYSKSSEPGLSFDVLMALGGLMFVCIVLLTAALFFIFKWIASIVSAWLEVILHRPSPQLAINIVLISSIGFVIVWFGTLLTVFQISAFAILRPSQILGPSSTEDIIGLISILGILVCLTSIGMWAAPLAAWFWRRRIGPSGSSWMLLDGYAAEELLPRQAPLRPGLALMIGVISGLIFCLALTAKRFNYLSVWTKIVNIPFPTAGVYWPSILIQMIAAAVAASWIHRLGGLHGLFAAFIAGSMIEIGWLLIFGAEGPVIPMFLITGALPVVPVAFGAAFLAKLIRHRRRLSYNEAI